MTSAVFRMALSLFLIPPPIVGHQIFPLSLDLLDERVYHSSSESRVLGMRRIQVVLVLVTDISSLRRFRIERINYHKYILLSAIIFQCDALKNFQPKSWVAAQTSFKTRSLVSLLLDHSCLVFSKTSFCHEVLTWLVFPCGFSFLVPTSHSNSDLQKENPTNIKNMRPLPPPPISPR